MFATMMFDKGVRKIVYDVEEGIELVAQTDKDGTLRFLVRKKLAEDTTVENRRKAELLNGEAQKEFQSGVNGDGEIELWRTKKEFYRPFKPSDEEKELIKNDYENGVSLIAIATAYHTTSYKIELLLRNMKVKMRKKAERSEHLSYDKKEEIIKLLTLGFDKDEIADELGISYDQVYYFCKNNNIIS